MEGEMKAILTVIGKDKVGIIAGVSNELQRLNINILDVNQTIIGEFFTMIMMLDLKLSNSNFEEIKKSLELKGKQLGVDVKIQREEIFNSIYSV
jgi:ACT domain-containing protein